MTETTTGVDADDVAGDSMRVADALLTAALAGEGAALDAVWQRRIAKLENFSDDRGLGLVRPPQQVVATVREVLSLIRQQRPDLPPPVIAPAPSGEVLVTWYSPRAQFVLSFENHRPADWFLNIAPRAAGTIDIADQSVLAPLAAAIGCAVELGRDEPAGPTVNTILAAPVPAPPHSTAPVPG